MKAYKSLSVLFVLFALLASCSSEKKKLLMPDSTRWTDQDIPLNELDTVNINIDSINIADEMRKLFPPSDSLIEGRPVSYYLNRADVSLTAKNFYLLRFIPTVNKATESICDSLLSRDDTTRPFYYFLFLRLNRISDGALAEMLPDYALSYSTQFVDEFYKKIHLPQYKHTYMNWVHYVSYMVWNSLDKGEKNTDSNEVRQYIINKQTQNAKRLTPSLRRDIEKFADDVAANPND
jgi:hypothetical protein